MFFGNQRPTKIYYAEKTIREESFVVIQTKTAKDIFLLLLSVFHKEGAEKMLGLPQNTEMNKQLPKKVIYTKFQMNTAAKEKSTVIFLKFPL